MAKLNLDNLPSKSYFSIEDVAQRWNCDVETVLNFIDEDKILKKALNSKQNGVIYLCKFEGIPESIVQLIKKEVRELYRGYLTGSKPFIELIGNQAIDMVGIEGYLSSGTFNGLSCYQVEESDISTFLYPVDEALICSPRYESDKFEKDRYNYFIEVQDFKGNHYMLLNCYFPTVQPVHPDMFNVISKEELDSFELHFGITEMTKNVENEINSKTENTYLAIIKALTEFIIDDDTIVKPHTVAAKIDYYLNKKGIKLPCSKETLANYLRK